MGRTLVTATPNTCYSSTRHHKDNSLGPCFSSGIQQIVWTCITLSWGQKTQRISCQMILAWHWSGTTNWSIIPVRVAVTPYKLMVCQLKQQIHNSTLTDDFAKIIALIQFLPHRLTKILSIWGILSDPPPCYTWEEEMIQQANNLQAWPSPSTTQLSSPSSLPRTWPNSTSFHQQAVTQMESNKTRSTRQNFVQGPPTSNARSMFLGPMRAATELSVSFLQTITVF